MRWIVWPMLLIVFGGCSSMDAAECRTADWRAIGYEDGAQGQRLERFGRRRKACARHNVAADFDAYLAGRSNGLTLFCRPYNGYRLGTRGYQYSGVCPAELEEAFLAAHADGHGLFERKTALERIRKHLNRSNRRSDKIEHLLTDKTAHLVSSDVDATTRASIVVELKQLTEEKVQLEARIKQLEHDYVEVEREYERYHAQIASKRTY